MAFWRSVGEGLGFIIPEPPVVAKVMESQAAMSTRSVTPPSRVDVTSVSVDAALNISVVYRAISIIVTSMTQMDMEVFRSGQKIPTPAIVKSPNLNEPGGAFIEETVFSLAAHGNAYWLLSRANYIDVPDNVTVLDPDTVSIRQDLDPQTGLYTGVVHYSIGQNEIPGWQIKHLKLMRRPGCVEGLGPIQSANSELLSAVRLRDFQDQWFSNSGVPTGMLTTDQTLSPKQTADYADAWNEFIAQHGGIAVLGQGLAYAPITIKPADAQFLEVWQATVTNIARLFGVPANLLLAEIQGGSETYTNIQDNNIVYLQSTLSRYMNEIENAMSDLIPRGQVVRFNEEQLLRLDTAALWAVRQIQNTIGYATANDFRVQDGLPPKKTVVTPPAPPKEESQVGVPRV